MKAASTGISVRPTTREASCEKATTTASWRYMMPEIPSMNRMGRKTTMVVRVVAISGAATSCVPSIAEAVASRPSSRLRKMFSSTTTALSSSMPTPSARPPKVMMLSV
jgi:hypothetical protein